MKYAGLARALRAFLEDEPMDEYAECAACGKPTPSENLNCIYCGEVLPRPVGVISGLRYSFKGRLAALIALAVLIGFLALVL